MKPGQFYCKNKECSAYRNSALMDWDGTSKFKCPSHLPNCEKDYLEPVPRPQQAWKGLLKPKALAVELLVLLILGWWLMPARKTVAPSQPPVDVIVAIDGGVFLNALMVYTPLWLSETSAKIAPGETFSFGLWAFRPIESNGTKEVELRNLTPSLQKLSEFKSLRIAGAPDPADIHEKVSISYDLFGDLKRLIEETKWSSPSNRNLIVITASSGLPKNDPGNPLHFDEFDVKKIAGEQNVSIYPIQVNIPLALIREDQKLARKQLTTLSSGLPGDGPFQVTTTATAEGDIRLVSNYETSVRAVFKEILTRIKDSQINPNPAKAAR